MMSASGRYVMVYNGEIYNFRQLGAELDTLGVKFRGHSDTEVMLAAFTRWGVRRSLERFNGMFAFALWDREDRALYIARDRFGEKPLYYGLIGKCLMFASELKALRAHPRFRPPIDTNALALYMQYGYVPTPYCIYENVRKLPPGSLCRLTSDPADWGTLESYWSAEKVAREAMSSEFSGSVEEATNELESLLDDAVRLRLQADVPLGAFLSGGLDSSAVAIMMQRHNSEPVRTFTVRFEEASHNEADEAQRVASTIGTQHTELLVSSSEAMAVIPQLPRLYDEPFADSSQIPTYLISSLARRHVTVSLSGDGGDELLAGYNRYITARGITRAIFRSPSLVRQTIARVLLAVPPRVWDDVSRQIARSGWSAAHQRHPGNKAHRLARALLHTQGRNTYDALMSVWHAPSEVVQGFRRTQDPPASDARGDGIHELQWMMLKDAVSYLPDDILVKVDRASMGVSLETRVPFLDPRVAQFCWSLPMAMKVRHGQQKWLLRQVLRRHLPECIIDRPKTGFAVPIGKWLRGPMKKWADDLLDPSLIRSQGLLHSNPVTSAWSRHNAQREDLQDRLWCILMFQSWLTQESAVRSG
jgi:asparagine synthase (glutamine-hydrolysing)